MKNHRSSKDIIRDCSGLIYQQTNSPGGFTMSPRVKMGHGGRAVGSRGWHTGSGGGENPRNSHVGRDGKIWHSRSAAL